MKPLYIYFILIIVSLFFFFTLSTPWNTPFQPIKFGSNKPHLLFHIGSRDKINYNIGYGYWAIKQSQLQEEQDNNKSMYSQFRYKYQNTENGLYVNMKNTNGENIIHQEIKDNTFKVNTQLKYIYIKNNHNQSSSSSLNNNNNNNNNNNQSSQDNNDKQYYQTQISIKQLMINNTNLHNIFKYKQKHQKRSQHESQHIQKKQQQQQQQQQQQLISYKSGNILWFMTLSIQNNDLRLTNHKDHLSPLCFSKKSLTSNQIQLNLLQLKKQSNTNKYDFSIKQTISIKSSNIQEIKMFGFTINITQSYQANHYIEEFQHLLELERYSHLNIQRKNDTKILQWENKQIQQIKKNKFQNKYTYVIVYGIAKRQQMMNKQYELPKIFITNSTDNKNKQFNINKFNTLAEQNKQQLFKTSLQPISSQQQKQFIQHVIFNLIGGLTYYQGKLYTQNSIMSHQHDYSYGFTPSRLIFPRSFLWDDGFHMTVMTKLKPQLTMKVLHNWLKKVDLFGWIGRQQIRGFQMGSLMPDSRFIFQDIFELNPPTIVLPIIKLIQNQYNLQSQTKSNLNKLLINHFPSLQKHFRYFLKTQSHFDLTYKQDLQKTIKYRWRCKDQCDKGNFMGSGLDDYPRLQNKTQISKEHVDLTSWLYLFADGLQNIAHYLNNTKAQTYYQKWKINLRQKIIQQCLDQSDMLFKDLAVKNKNIFIDQKVTKIGYINLFPFFVGLLQPQPNQSLQLTQRILTILSKTISIMMDQTQLLSKGGIRSLSLNDPDFASQQNYWRGAVWMPINYMILRACKKYYWNIQSNQHKEKIHELYNQLRKRLINTVKENYEKSGYLFENYIEGKGNRGYPFYGWTSLIASIILEDY